MDISLKSCDTFWNSNMNTNSHSNHVKAHFLTEDITLSTTDRTYQWFILDEPLDVKVNMPCFPTCGLRFVIINLGEYPFSVGDHSLKAGFAIELKYSGTDWVKIR
jgi:hypothetical protein